uniref:NADH-ubiquinone oxidoreductase chain 2 n=1 Tax=Partulina redfieldi TaxID=115954 RepID=A0A3S5HWT2_9EUPU|nr:NADH dehydrogenase subunit 2 [Partulina redfieldi]AZZ06752.1 NADH dehydrogenase subunit 2 [Partulina redfieldi]
MMTMYYIIFMYIVLLAPFLSISSSNWLILWVLMEISLFSMMPLFTKSKMKDGNMLGESMMKYFIVQSVASLILMVSGISLYMNLMFEEYIYWVIFSMMVFLKLGIFPLSFWVIPVLKGVNSLLIFFLLGPMKIVPLYLMYFHLNFYYKTDMKWMFYIIIGVSSMVIGALVGNNMTEFRSMIGASSITHSGWFVIASTVTGLFTYFFLYMMSLSFLLTSLIINTTKTSLAHCMVMLSLSGLPPFLLFYAKYLVFSNMLLMQVSLVFLMIVLFSAVLSLNIYLKFSYNFILNYVKNNSFMKMKKDIVYLLIFTFLSLGTSILLMI